MKVSVLNLSREFHAEARQGILSALPIVLGYFPIGFSFGVLANQTGISFFAAFLMSVIVYAGASQFLALGMLATQMPVASIVVSTFIVNLRHLLMSTALAPYVSRWSLAKRIAMASELTDETFALHSVEFQKGIVSWPRVLTSNGMAHLAWVLATVIGYQASSLLGDTSKIGLDFALPGMFIGLIVLQLRSRILWVASLVAGLTVLGLEVSGFSSFAVIVASLIGATVGAVLEVRCAK